MPRTIRITAGNVTMDATLNETATASEIWDALPITARANIWGDEIYFAIPFHRAEENAKATVGLGDLGYWPPGNAFCIFYGPTPMSRGDEIRPASPVNIVGKVVGDAKAFKQVSSDTKVTITEA